MRIYDRNSHAGIKVSEEEIGGAQGVRGAGADSPVAQGAAHGEAAVSLQPMENPMLEQVGVPEAACDLV